MGNLITSSRRGADHDLQLSNGSTSVLLSVLLLSGSQLAESVWEQELMTWLAEHDQEVFGSGMVGFDLDDIAWDVERFDVQQQFVLRMIDLALHKHRWNELGYDPPFVAAQLGALRTLVADFRPDAHPSSTSSRRTQPPMPWSTPRTPTPCRWRRRTACARGPTRGAPHSGRAHLPLWASRLPHKIVTLGDRRGRQSGSRSCR